MAVFMMAIPFIKKRRPFKFLAMCFIAFSIHRVAIIVLPLYFVYNIKITRVLYTKLCVALMGLFAISPLLANFVIEPLLEVLGKTTYRLDFDMSLYIVLMAMVAFFVLLFASFEKLFVKNPENNFLCWAFLLAIAIEIFGLYNATLARAIYIPYIAVVALIPNVLYNYKRSDVAMIGKLGFSCLLFAFYLFQLRGSPLIPYVFWLQ